MRASMVDVILLPVILVATLIPIGAAFILNSQIQQQFVQHSPQTEHVFQSIGGAIDLLLGGLLIFYIILMVGAVILAYFSPSHPAFFPISVFFAALGTLVAYIMGDFGSQFLSGIGASQMQSFSFVVGFVLPYLPHITVLMWFLIAVVMYGNIKAFREGMI